MIYKVVNQTKEALVVDQARLAKGFGQRLVGLMFKESMARNQALMFYNASAIHTCFMRFAIDVVFLNKKLQVAKVYPALKPWRLASCPGSYLTLELAAGRAAETMEAGDTLQLIDGE